MSASDPKRVAVIGGGVAGMAAAWHLEVNASSTCQVQLFEAQDRLGGHAYTVNVDGTDVDVGFMVFNHSHYPNLVQWFAALGIEEENTDMSLSVSLDQGRTVEWSSYGLRGLFAKRSQALSPTFYQFIGDMMRFNSHAAELLALPNDDPRRHVTTGQYLRDHGYSSAFAHYYLVPMTAALWSASMEDVLEFPAAQLIGFFCNHHLLQMFNRPQWKTVSGRSQQYTNKIRELLGEKVHLSTPIEAVRKLDDGTYQLTTSQGQVVEGVFDHVVLACHPPTARTLLENGLNSDSELLHLLAQIEYADNIIYVHSDPDLMPVRRDAWASWNCLGRLDRLQNMASQQRTKSAPDTTSHDKKPPTPNQSAYTNGHTTNGTHEPSSELEGTEGRMKAVYVTYWLNNLQNLASYQNIFVSLNPHTKPAHHLTHRRLILAHPQFTLKALNARKTLAEKYQGRGGLWFCGAWEMYGFHEDGCRSGFTVASQLSGVKLPWCRDHPTDVYPLPDLSRSKISPGWIAGVLNTLYKRVARDLPIAVCKRIFYHFLRSAVQKGTLRLKFNDGSVVNFGDGTPCGSDPSPVTMRIFDEWFFVKLALEYDLGLARSYLAGHFVIEPLEKREDYNQLIHSSRYPDETSLTLGDPVGLTRFFLLLIANRDLPSSGHVPRISGRGHTYSNSLTNASGLIISKIGTLLGYLRYTLTMDNSERGGSLKNIHAHYDLSNDLFKMFLDHETMMYSCAIFDANPAPNPNDGLIFRGSLADAQLRKIDTLLQRAQIQPAQTILDIGFGWGGLSIQAAKRYGCKVIGITLSIEQKALAEERVRKQGLEHLITFEVVDYRTFARRKENLGKFDRVLSCEMIEAVGHRHLGEFFGCIERVLSREGVLVMQAITTPEQRYETYRRSVDFINTVIFPGGLCPSLHALVDAAYKESSLTLEHIDNIGLHYAHTLREWRRRFNSSETLVRRLGFDDVFLRCWNYYLTYCEAGFITQTVNDLILVFARPGCKAIVPLSSSGFVVRQELTDREIQNWLTEG